jgi:hypothetical protein
MLGALGRPTVAPGLSPSIVDQPGAVGQTTRWKTALGSLKEVLER